MAKIVTITNPLTGQPTQVDQLDHTAQQIDDGLNIARGVSNPNLLDNWYFGNPVNQRGFSGQNTTGGYFLDRLLGYNCSYTDGALKIKKGMFDESVNGYIIQRVEPSRSNDLNGKLCTFSAIVNGDLICGTAAYSNTSEVEYTNENGVRLYTQVSNGLVELTAVTDQPVEKAILAWKIELGDHQTLAHQDSSGNWVLNEIPDYGEQLRRCQYYSRFFGEDIEIPCSNNQAGSYIEGTLPLTMRSGSGAISYGTSYLFFGDRTFYQVTSANVTSNGGRVKIGVNVNSQLTANQQATLHLTNCSILFDL